MALDLSPENPARFDAETQRRLILGEIASQAALAQSTGTVNVPGIGEVPLGVPQIASIAGIPVLLPTDGGFAVDQKLDPFGLGQFLRNVDTRARFSTPGAGFAGRPSFTQQAASAREILATLPPEVQQYVQRAYDYLPGRAASDADTRAFQQEGFALADQFFGQSADDVALQRLFDLAQSTGQADLFARAVPGYTPGAGLEAFTAPAPPEPIAQPAPAPAPQPAAPAPTQTGGQSVPTNAPTAAGAPTNINQLLLGLANGGVIPGVGQGINVNNISSSGFGLGFGSLSPTGIPGLNFTGGSGLGVLQAPPSGGNGLLDILGGILNGPGTQPGGGVLAPTSTNPSTTTTSGPGIFEDIFGSIGDVLGQIPGVGGVLESGSDILGGIVQGGSDILGSIIGPVLGGIFGGGGGSGGTTTTGGGQQQAGGINVGQILGGLLGGGGAAGGGGSAGLLTLLGALAGGLFGENLNEERAEQRTNVAPISPEEAALLGINTQLAQGQLDAFQQARGIQGETGSALSQALQSLAAERQAANAGGLGALQGQEAVASVADSAGQRQTFNAAQDRVLQQLLGGGVADPATQALIEQQAQLARQQGEADIARFVEEQAERIRLSSAARGLESYDTPILNRFDDLGAEATKAFSDLTRGIQQEQVRQSLQLPLQQGSLGVSQLGTLGSTSLGARGLNEQIGRSGLGFQLGAGQQAGSLGLGLGTGAGPNQTLGLAQQPRLATRRVESIGQPSALQSFANTAAVGGGLGEALDRLRLFG